MTIPFGAAEHQHAGEKRTPLVAASRGDRSYNELWRWPSQPPGRGRFFRLGEQPIRAGGIRMKPTRVRSREAFARAGRLIPGGVNSPARAFGAVGGQPIFIARGEGARLFDLDGNDYLDY